MREIGCIETVLTDFETIRLSKLIPQDESCSLLSMGMAKALAVKSEKTSKRDVDKIYRHVRSKFFLCAVSNKAIKQRYMTLWPEQYDTVSDVKKNKIIDNDHFVNYDIEFPMYEDLARFHTNPEGANLSARMDLYKLHAEQHIRRLYNEVFEVPDQIIHVTSTGYFDPNPVATILSEKQWYDVELTNFYHKSSNATISAIGNAYAYMRSSHAGGYEKPKKRIDLVHSELFSAHIKIADDQPFNIMLMSTLSDSFLRYSVRNYEDVLANDKDGLKILAFKHMMIPGTTSVIELKVSNPAFDYKLDALKYLKMLSSNVKQFVTSFLKEVGLDYKEVKKRLIFVIPASSSMIIKQIKKELQLSDEQIALSQTTLYENGYLSSGAIPYMCKELIESDTIPAGQKVFCLGHGNGILLSGMLLEKM